MTQAIWERDNFFNRLIDGERPFKNTFGSMAVGLTAIAMGVHGVSNGGSKFLTTILANSSSVDPAMGVIASTALLAFTAASGYTGVLGAKCIYKVSTDTFDAMKDWVHNKIRSPKVPAKGNKMIVSQKSLDEKSNSDKFFVGTIGKNDFVEVDIQGALKFRAEHKKSGKLVEISESVSVCNNVDWRDGRELKVRTDNGTEYISEDKIFEKHPDIEAAYRSAVKIEKEATQKVIDTYTC